MIYLLVLLVSSALAQQPDPAFLQRAATALQQQRNECQDQQANIRIALLTSQEEVEKLKKEIEALKAEKAK